MPNKTRKLGSIEEMELDKLRCRTFGHAWDEFVPVGMKRPMFGWRFSLLCTSCGAEKHELIDTHGNVAQREYRYPEGYLLEVRTKRPEARVLYERRRKRSQLDKRKRS